MKKKGATSRFPVARIKKIMQADEDVGKVAQATPLVVSKAVEMFLEELVQAAADQAQDRGAKKIQSYHLKQAIFQTESFDFLKDIVAAVPDPVAVSADGAKGKGKGKGRKKKEADEDDEGEAEMEDAAPAAAVAAPVPAQAPPAPVRTEDATGWDQAADEEEDDDDDDEDEDYY